MLYFFAYNKYDIAERKVKGQLKRHIRKIHLTLDLNLFTKLDLTSKENIEHECKSMEKKTWFSLCS